jgi:hypothetical protein
LRAPHHEGSEDLILRSHAQHGVSKDEATGLEKALELVQRIVRLAPSSLGVVPAKAGTQYSPQRMVMTGYHHECSEDLILRSIADGSRECAPDDRLRAASRTMKPPGWKRL